MSQRFLLAMLLLFLISPHVHAQQIAESTEQTATSPDALPAAGGDPENVTEFAGAPPRNSNVTEPGGAPPRSIRPVTKPGGAPPRISNVTKPGGEIPPNSSVTEFESPRDSNVTLGGGFNPILRNSSLTKPGGANPANGNVTELRRRFEQLNQECRAVTGELKGPISDPEERGKLEAKLRDRVRQAFVVCQQLRRAELAGFTKRLDDLQRSIELRDRIAEKIIVRRVEELLDPNLEWDAANDAAQEARIIQGKTVTQQQTVTKEGNSTPAASSKGEYEMRVPAKVAPTVIRVDGDEINNDVIAPAPLERSDDQVERSRNYYKRLDKLGVDSNDSTGKVIPQLNEDSKLSSVVTIENGIAEIAASSELPYEVITTTIQNLQEAGVRKFKFAAPKEPSDDTAMRCEFPRQVIVALHS